MCAIVLSSGKQMSYRVYPSSRNSDGSNAVSQYFVCSFLSLFPACLPLFCDNGGTRHDETQQTATKIPSSNIYIPTAIVFITGKATPFLSSPSRYVVRSSSACGATPGGRLWWLLALINCITPDWSTMPILVRRAKCSRYQTQSLPCLLFCM